MIKSKKGLEMNMNVIIVLILLVLLLVVLALGFTMGWTNLYNRIFGISVIYSQGDLDSARSLCETKDLEGYCTDAVLLYNSKTKLNDQFYCYDSKIKAVLRYPENGSIMVKYTLTGRPSQCTPYDLPEA